MKKSIAAGSFVLMGSLLLSVPVPQALGNSRLPHWLVPAGHWNAFPQLGQTAPQWKTRDEYDAFNAAANEAEPNRRIYLAETFIQKFPRSDFRDSAYVLEMRAYAELNDLGAAVYAARRALALNPNNVIAQGYLRGMGKTAEPLAPQEPQQEVVAPPEGQAAGLEAPPTSHASPVAGNKKG